MNRILLITLIALVFSCNKPETKDYLPLHNKKVLILGNSITQDGRYVDFIEYFLRKSHPKESLDIISIGLSSETASGDSELDHPFPRPWIHNRLDNALKQTQPDLVLACYGMNDGIYSDFDSIRFNNYKKGILKLKEKVEAQGANIIFLSPTIFDAEQKKDYLFTNSEHYSYNRPYTYYNEEVLKTYANWLKEIDGVQTIDLYSYLTKVQTNFKKQDSSFTLIPDAVHPNAIGHFYMAKKVLKDLYPDVSTPENHTIINTLGTDTLFNLIRKRRYIRSEGWRQYIGYGREVNVKTDDIKPTIKQVEVFDKMIAEFLDSQ